MTPLSALDAALPAPIAAKPPVASTRAEIAKVAERFESSFLSIMLGQLFQGVETSAPFGGGQGEAAYKSFLTDAFAKSMAHHGGIGVSKAISAEMLKLQGLE